MLGIVFCTVLCKSPVLALLSLISVEAASVFEEIQCLGGMLVLLLRSYISALLRNLTLTAKQENFFSAFSLTQVSFSFIFKLTRGQQSYFLTTLEISEFVLIPHWK